MPRARIIVPVVLMLVALSSSVFWSESPESSDADLEKQVADLSKRIEVLEAQVKALQGRSAQRAAPSAQPDQEALVQYRKIGELVSSGEMEEAKKELEVFNKKYANTPSSRLTRSLTRELEVVGKDAPEDLAVEKWFQGDSELDIGGKGTTLVIFWEVWCPHCKREVPKLQKVYEDHKDDGLQVLGLTKITRSATEEKVKQFIAEKKLEFPIGKENGEMSRYFNVQGIPAAAVVKDGTIVWRGHPVRLTEEMLKKWL